MDTTEAIIIRNQGDGIAAQYDRAARKILMLKHVIARILKGIVPQFADLSPEEIVKHHIIADSIASGSPVSLYEDNATISGEDPRTNENDLPENVFDVKFRARIREGYEARCFLHIDLEGQLDFEPGYCLAKRANYHLARLLSTQIDRIGKNGDGYNKLSKVLSIWICFNPPEETGNSITRMKMVQSSTIGNFSFPEDTVDLQEAVYVLLGNENDDAVKDNDFLRFVDILFSGELSADERISKLGEMGFPVEEDEFEKEVREMAGYALTYNDTWGAKKRKEGDILGQLKTLWNYVHNTGDSPEQGKVLLGISDEVFAQFDPNIKPE